MQHKKTESTSLPDQANSEKKFTLIFCLKVLLWANNFEGFLILFQKEWNQDINKCKLNNLIRHMIIKNDIHPSP